MNKKKVLVIVAHPDDETVWMGGTLIRNSVLNEKWDVTVISLCRKDDPDRAPKFQKVCEKLKARSFISDLEDEKLTPISTEEVIKRIQQFTEKNYDFIFTHGENGEYGHTRHIDVYRAVKEMLDKKLISCKKNFYFAYKMADSNRDVFDSECNVNPNADKFIKLNNFELLTKKDLIQNFYGFKKNSFEEKNCKNREAFIEKTT